MFIVVGQDALGDFGINSNDTVSAVNEVERFSNECDAQSCCDHYNNGEHAGIWAMSFDYDEFMDNEHYEKVLVDVRRCANLKVGIVE